MQLQRFKINKYIRDVQPPYLQQNGHLQTIVPAVFRKVSNIKYTRERIPTPDHDFLDLDWMETNSRHLVIICHGLEGNSHRAYIKGMARYFHACGWSALAWNFRGCSEDMNLQIKFYHSGATEDLETVIRHVNKCRDYHKLYLLGFSLGGNLILKYLGEMASTVQDNISRAICFSVPLDLHHSCLKISKGFNRVYSARFLRMLKEKVHQKAKRYPDVFDLKVLNSVNTLIEFDDVITAPIHGFKNAIDYYHKCSSLNYIERIAIPTLVVNAKNDPLLSESCYPDRTLNGHPFVEMLFPSNGGHCGFADRNFIDKYWSEILAWKYLNSY